MSSENPQSIFQLTPSRRATVTWVPILCSQIFQLTPSRRATREPVCHIQAEEFQLTPSRRATKEQILAVSNPIISTHALTEGDGLGCTHFPASTISTHALTEGDGNPEPYTEDHCISTHALTEGDSYARFITLSMSAFQLTPSRRATSSLHLLSRPLVDFNSRPHGGRPSPVTPIRFIRSISTHALTEGDEVRQLLNILSGIFQLTPSRRATHNGCRGIFRTEFQLTPSRRATANLDKFFF